MRKHFRAPGPRARAARSCLGAITGSLIIMGLTACGGGGSDTTEGSTSPQSLSDSPARAQAMPVTVPTATLIKDTGSSTALPALEPWTYAPPPINGTIHYIDSLYSIRHATAQDRNGQTPATAWGNIRDFKNNVLLSAKLKSGDAILFKCGGVWREGLELIGYKNLYIGTYQPNQSGPRDCSDDQLPIIRSSDARDLGWSVPDDNGISSAEVAVNKKVFRLFRHTIPLPEARHPNANSPQPYFLASQLEKNQNETESAFSERKKSQFKLRQSEITALAEQNNGLDGATVYIKSKPWLVERMPIQSYEPSTGIVKLNGAAKYSIEDGEGYYFVGKKWMIDQPGEWCQHSRTEYIHNTTTGKFDAFTYRTVFYKPQTLPIDGIEYTWDGSTDINGTVDSLNYRSGIAIRNSEDIKISRIRFEHQEYSALAIESSKDVRITGVEILFPLEIGIEAGRYNGGDPSTEILIDSNKIRGAGAFGIRAGGVYKSGGNLFPVVSKVIVRNNFVTETGLHGSGRSIKDRTAIRIGGVAPDADGGPNSSGPPDAQALGNVVFNNASVGIHLDNGRHGAVIDGNTVVNACLLVTDCGGIYANNHDVPQLAAEGKTSARISNNIVVGVKGNIDGAGVGSEANRLGREQTFGIYLDDGAANVEVFNNQISHASGGIYLHNTAWTDIHHNTIKRVTLGSIKVNSDRPQINSIEQMRGNVIRDNTLFSHRAVDSKQFTTGSLSNGIQGAAPQVYAQLWVHDSLNPSVFFTGDRPNESRNNTVVTHSKVSPTLPTTWRTNSASVSNNNAPQTTQSSGGIWWLTNAKGADGYNKEIALPEWLRLVQASPTSADVESSPVSYRPFALTLGNDGKSLIDPIAQGSRWTWIPGTAVPYATGTATCGEASVCAAVTASQSWHTLISNPFTTTEGQLYFVSYTLKQGSIKGVHNATVRRDAEPNRYAMVGEYLQNVETNSNELRYYEHFFRGNAQSGANTVLHLKPSDGAANYTTQYFSNATVQKVDAVAVLPGLDQLGVTAVNASSNDRIFSCTDLGLSGEQCNNLRDENNQSVGPSVQVNARTMKRLYVHLPTFSN